MTDRTTIEVSIENWQWLNSLKQRPQESFNDVLDRLRTGKTTPETGITADPDSLPESLDLPGSGETLERRRAAIAQLYAYLQEHGTATKSELLELIDPDDVGYSSAESFWSNAIKGRETLRALPEIDAPGEGERTWRYIDS